MSRAIGVGMRAASRCGPPFNFANFSVQRENRLAGSRRRIPKSRQLAVECNIFRRDTPNVTRDSPTRVCCRLDKRAITQARLASRSHTAVSTRLSPGAEKAADNVDPDHFRMRANVRILYIIHIYSCPSLHSRPPPRSHEKFRRRKLFLGRNLSCAHTRGVPR